MISENRRAQILAFTKAVEKLVENDQIKEVGLGIDQGQLETVRFGFETYINNFTKIYIEEYERLKGDGRDILR